MSEKELFCSQVEGEMKEYVAVLRQIKSEILSSRYLIAKMANRELLNLYFRVGKVVSEKAASGKWGSGTIKKLSDDLQTELKGLRGFSSTNIKRMRQFYESWEPYFLISPLTTDQLENNSDKTGIIEKSSLSLLLEMSTKQWELLPMKQVKNYLRNTGIFCRMQRH